MDSIFFFILLILRSRKHHFKSLFVHANNICILTLVKLSSKKKHTHIQTHKDTHRHIHTHTHIQPMSLIVCFFNITASSPRGWHMVWRRWGKQSGFQAEEDLLRPIPNIVLVQCVEMTCMMACCVQKSCMRSIHQQTLAILSLALAQPSDRTQPCTVHCIWRNGKSSIPAAILSVYKSFIHLWVGRHN
jgi:hypothetical protein